MKTEHEEHDAADLAATPSIEDQTALYELERERSVIRDRVRDVVARRHTSTYISGPPGTGKTSLVCDTLDDLGEPYHYHQGHVTAMGYFDLLRRHNDDVIVLDDVSSLFRDKVGQQLLLASLGTAGPGDWTRVIRYQRQGKNVTVNFSGGLIALSNLSLHDNDEIMLAIKSRTKPLCWNPTDVQLAAVMRQAVKNGWKLNDVKLTAAECREAVTFVVNQCRHYNVRMDLRLLFDGALPDFAASKAGEHEVDWRDHTLMTVRRQVRRLQFTGAPKARAERIQMEQKIAERIRAAYSTRREQVEAWMNETGKSERAFDRRAADMRIAE